MKPLALVLLLAAIVGFGALFYFNVQPESRDCPGHWHSTFAVFTPDAEGNPRRLDMGGPRDGTGGNYYQLNHFTGQSLSVHMHQSGPEQGSTILGEAQLHFEGNKCVGLRSAMRSADVLLDEDAITITGQHSQTEHTGTWTNSGDDRLRFFVQSWDEGARAWTWSERELGDYLTKQMRDGEAFVLAFGNYTDAQVKAMQDQVPAPISRSDPKAPATETDQPHAGETTGA